MEFTYGKGVLKILLMPDNPIEIGTDIIEIYRVKDAVEKSRRFKERVYTSSEIQYCEGRDKNAYASYAGIYAAKEAFCKALRIGFRNGSWQDINVMRTTDGAPYIELSGVFREIFESRGFIHCSLSISHSKEYATAQVLLVKQ